MKHPELVTTLKKKPDEINLDNTQKRGKKRRDFKTQRQQTVGTLSKRKVQQRTREGQGR